MGSQFPLDPSVLMDLVDPKDPQTFYNLGGTPAISAKLRTSIKDGLSQRDINHPEKRIHRYGRNVLPVAAGKSFLRLMWEGLQDKTLIMLSISAIVSLVLGIYEDPGTGWIEGSAIILAVLIVVTVAAGNDYQKELQFRKLNAKKDLKDVEVIRAGKKGLIPVADVLVGDLVCVEPGVIISADGIVVNAHNLKCDESGATGEPDAIKKGLDIGLDPFILSGTQVMEGVGQYIVTAVGVQSFHGKTMMSLRTENESTPLQDKLENLAERIAMYGIYASAVTIFLLVLKYLMNHLLYVETPFNAMHFLSQCVNYIITGITILVVAVPEGLPLAVTVALAYSMLKMLDDQNLVRRLEACETMGGATNICSDKTGTLTQNRMSVVQALFFDEVPGTLEQAMALAQHWPVNLRRIVESGICVNSTAYRENTNTEYIGSRTESALLQFAADHLNSDYAALRSKSTIAYVYPFSSKAKSMGVVEHRKKSSHDTSIKDFPYRVYVKGAAEIVLRRCSRTMDRKGNIWPMTPERFEEIEQTIKLYALDSLRTICMAFNNVKHMKDWSGGGDPTATPINSDLIFVGIVGIADPIRPEVPSAVATCQRAGITVRMVTGDNLLTAKNIARQCGIYHEGLAMEGPVFRNLQGKALEEACLHLEVLARSSPMDKQILVSKLKEMGEIVAVTGDGTNDGPALKLAHVGFSMGITGTEVAKEASDIILMDDNFSSIVLAVMWGRNVYGGIRKFLVFQLTVNIVAVFASVTGSLLNDNGESPLKPVALLWVNCIMDSFGALALATESPKPSLLERQPCSNDEPIITTFMWCKILGQAAFQLVLNSVLLYYPSIVFGDIEVRSTYHLTLFFNVFVMCQLFNEINARKIDGELNVFSGILDNLLFVGVMLFSIMIQFLFVQNGGEFVGCVPLSFNDWVLCIFLGSLSLPVGFFIHLISNSFIPQHTPPRTVKRRWRNAYKQVVTSQSVVRAFRRSSKRL